MPAIFKNIRRKLAAENKTVAYLRYALGEILLVVIGILIALQVNNWNENRKQENSKRHLMLAIKQELLNNKETLQSFEIGLNKSITKFNQVLQYSAGANPTLPADSLKQYLSNMVYPITLSIINSVQEDAVSSGKFELLSDSLKFDLSILKDYTDSRNSIIEQRNEIFNNDPDNRIRKLMAMLSSEPHVPDRYAIHPPIPEHPKFKLNDAKLIALIKDPETYLTLNKIYGFYRDDEIWTKFGLLQMTNKTIDLINRELKKQ